MTGPPQIQEVQQQQLNGQRTTVAAAAGPDVPQIRQQVNISQHRQREGTPMHALARPRPRARRRRTSRIRITIHMPGDLALVFHLANEAVRYTKLRDTKLPGAVGSLDATQAGGVAVIVQNHD
jgi:hypothetical protein